MENICTPTAPAGTPTLRSLEPRSISSPAAEAEEIQIHPKADFVPDPMLVISHQQFTRVCIPGLATTLRVRQDCAWLEAASQSLSLPEPLLFFFIDTFFCLDLKSIFQLL